ncbi:MAG TPA: hypothetical protein VG890_10070 [Puia sp.]|nr:hypothetical protein [Puia sp.]
MDIENPDISNQYDGIFSGLPEGFEMRALDLFERQYAGNALYRSFVDSLRGGRQRVSRLENIPFLPVSFFKTEEVKTGDFIPEIVFESSGTTGMQTSRHFLRSATLYRESFLRGFERFYGPAGDYCMLGLLPAYLERSGSSLVYMVDELIRRSHHPQSGFYLYALDQLHQVLSGLEKRKQKTILIGVSFALVDFAAQYPLHLEHTIVMETGGMKGRRREMTRGELHDTLTRAFSLEKIHSEYGMTELLSQAYSAGNGLYRPVSWLKPMVRMEDDPLEVSATGEGLLNLIDLANIDSCAFIATDDLARVHPDGSFEVLGRMDNSDLRGCSLLAV